jgi:hypothetical protein
MKNPRLFLLALLLLPAACQRQAEETRPTIPLVREILGERTDPRAQMLRDWTPQPVADIALIGTEFTCDRLSEALMVRDRQDNVDARWTPDGLPDFAGETFVCLEDATPYADALARDGEEALRGQTVLRVLAALDTVVHISPYDLEGLSVKPSSKMIVLSDPYLSEYGGFDVDTLLRSAGCPVPVLSPIDKMIEQAFEKGARGDLSVGIICDPRFESAGIYERIFARKAAERGCKGAGCVVVGMERRDSVLYHFLDRYQAAGHTRPLDVILVDNLSLDMDRIKGELAQIVSVMNESSMTLGRLFSRNFFFVDAFETVSEQCYYYLREKNLFTHNIAKPQVTVYRPIRKPETEDGSIILIPGSYVQN